MTNATFSLGDASLDLPLVEAREGNNGYDIGKLLGGTGAVTYDQGFSSTASCK